MLKQHKKKLKSKKKFKDFKEEWKEKQSIELNQ
jgi:hypothetical protein